MGSEKVFLKKNISNHFQPNINNSEILYQGRVADARRILLHMFDTRKYVRRIEVNEIAQLPHPIITNLFVEIATRVPGESPGDPGRWVLKMGRDDAFCSKFPSIVAEQASNVALEAER
jgi:hypothetical protein